MNRIEALQANFCCAKCRGRSAHVDRAHLPLTGGRFPLKPGRFVVVTCTLCGYTEFYDQALFAEERETAENAAHNPAKPVTGSFSA